MRREGMKGNEKMKIEGKERERMKDVYNAW